jgi:GNAT superfamily N-acetyltransferase
MNDNVNMAQRYEYEIPEGYEAKIEGGKVIIEMKESEDERIRRDILETLSYGLACEESILMPGVKTTLKEATAYLEKQKEQKEKVATEWPNLSNCYRNCKKCMAKCFYRKEPYEEKKPAEWSEDERIRQCIGLSLTDVDEQRFKDFGTTLKECLAYIERQKGQTGKKWIYEDDYKSQLDAQYQQGLEDGRKEQKPEGWSEDYRDEDLRTRFAFYTYKDEDDVLYLSNVFVEETSRNKGFGTKILAAAEKVAETIGAINIRLKVKQDSSANAWYRKHGYGYIAFEGDYDWLEKTLEYLKPSKQEWSDEDYKIIESINMVFDMCAAKNIATEETTLYKLRAWLKHLPERINLQPKQEWSDDDKTRLKVIKEELERFIMFKQYGTPLSTDDIEWLKSLPVRFNLQPKQELDEEQKPVAHKNDFDSEAGTADDLDLWP